MTEQALTDAVGAGLRALIKAYRFDDIIDLVGNG